MRQLVFFTSNQTKLAHARHVAEQYPLRIVGFRQRTYHADYDEPRSKSRTELLKASYDSARLQCVKAGISLETTPFILEDTSLRVEALSSATEDVPGTEVKFWMAEQTFERLDRELRERGGDRRATVRSDVVLHVPASIREAWHVRDDFLVFTGLQTGTVAEEDREFATNLVFPWLDSRTFNRWFRPDGCEAPFGALPIQIADQVDFRRSSFGGVFRYLVEAGYASVPRRQLELGLGGAPSIIICGYTCSGKTTAAQRLAREFGYLHVEASDFMHLAYHQRHGHHAPARIGDFAEEALRQKPLVAAEQAVSYALQNEQQPAVISGFRSLAEVEFAQRAFAEAGKSAVKIFVDASLEARFERLRRRLRTGDELDRSKLEKRDDQQRRMGLTKIEASPSFRHLTNDGTLPEYLRKVDRLAGSTLRQAIDLPEYLDELRAVTEIRLEDAIKVALLTAWDDSERRTSFSTTEIARMIGATFPNAPAKHKDNVSRHFNQDFYPDYEFVEDEGRRLYRLSNTGYGEAINVVRNAISNLRSSAQTQRSSSR